METVKIPFRQDRIGNILFEFFTDRGGMSVEAWRGTRMCRVTVCAGGVRRFTELRLKDDMWWKLINPVAYSGFWNWEKRYSASPSSDNISWRLNVAADGAWFRSSGDGLYPEGLPLMMAGLLVFMSEVHDLPCPPAGAFLPPGLLPSCLLPSEGVMQV